MLRGRCRCAMSVECHPVLVVGLTGGIGSGKSTVARMLAERGAVVVDADAIAREVVEPGQPAFDEIVARFGPEVVAADGTLDRERLADIVFADDEARAALNAMTHPRIGQRFFERVSGAPDDAIVICDVPLLAESQAKMYGTVVVVEAPESTRLDRLEGRGVRREDARARMATQAGDEDRRAIADVVIDNGGSLDAVTGQVDALWAKLLRMAHDLVADER